jgi:hypothetical protein
MSKEREANNDSIDTAKAFIHSTFIELRFKLHKRAN